MKENTKHAYMSSNDRMNQILDVACRLFAEKSYDTVSVREIARECDCASSLIIKHFGAKENIYNSLFAEWVEMCKEPLIEKIPEGNASLALEQVYNSLTVGVYKHERSYRPNLTQAVQSRVGFQQHILTIKKTNQDIANEIILPIIIRGQKEGVFKQGNPNELADEIWAVIYATHLLNKSFTRFKTVRYELVKEIILGV